MSNPAYLFANPWFDPQEKWAALHFGGTPLDAAACEHLRQIRSKAAADDLIRQLPWVLHEAPALAAGPIAADDDDRKDILIVEAGATAARLDELRQLGWQLGADSDALPPASHWDYLLCDATTLRGLTPGQRVTLQDKAPLIAVQIGSKEMFEAIRDDCALAGSEYLFAYDNAGRKPDMSRVHLLKLLALIVQDADTCEIEEIFRHEPKLSYSLMRLVNSPAVSPHAHITTFGQAITLLGRRHLQRWLQLLIYADHQECKTINPLLLHAAARGRLLELCAPAMGGREVIHDLPSVAFMTGIFSLLDLLLGLPMPEVLAQLPLPDSVARPLARRETALGTLLGAVEASDLGHHDKAATLLTDLGIAPARFLADQLAALSWAHQIGNAASGN
jgi:hypothetical protein